MGNGIAVYVLHGMPYGVWCMVYYIYIVYMYSIYVLYELITIDKPFII